MKNAGLFVFVSTFVSFLFSITLQIVEIRTVIRNSWKSCWDHHPSLNISFYSYVSPLVRVCALHTVLFSVVCVHFCVHQNKTVFNAFAQLISNKSTNQPYILTFSSAAKVIFARLFRVVGGSMTSTVGLIKKAKEDLQKLRQQYLKAASDPAEERRLRSMIERQKQLLEELGAANG